MIIIYRKATGLGMTYDELSTPFSGESSNDWGIVDITAETPEVNVLGDLVTALKYSLWCGSGVESALGHKSTSLEEYYTNELVGLLENTSGVRFVRLAYSSDMDWVVDSEETSYAVRMNCEKGHVYTHPNLIFLRNEDRKNERSELRLDDVHAQRLGYDSDWYRLIIPKDIEGNLVCCIGTLGIEHRNIPDDLFEKPV